MSDTSRWDIRLGPKQLRRRTFMLGNKQALTLSLPAAAGCSPALSHPHKWFGAYSYGRKALEGQTVRAGGPNGPLLCARNQTGFTMTLTCARREFEVEGERYSEAYFVPDAMDGFACELAGPALVVEPAFDLRFYRALNVSFQGYTIEEVAHGAVVSNVLPAGRYDDLTETFIADETSGDEQRLFVAVQAVGDGAEVEVLPIGQRARRRIFRKDQQRRRLVAHSAFAGEDGDHAPLWTRSVSSVYAPVRIHLHRQGVVVYGVGSSREEALEAAGTIAGNLTGFEVQKVEQAEAILEHARLETGNERTDRAYAQVLTRLTDTLVARQAKAPDTQLERPSTMILAGNQYFHDSWKRDENIALGFLLALGFYDLARDVIADTWRLQDERTGRLPQRIRAGEDLPYHSSDGTLWALL
ncbi:MAG TPA: amylo-alpha-1,6-glucosidase, partial [Chloroflexota bacterium]|nr:amylo-alpha-1,6-glucosidase [Chloroflexota bacterium]